MVKSEVSEEQLIAEHIIERPHGASRAEARVADNGMHVWVMVNYLRGVNGNVKEAAAAYGLSLDAVRAVIAFYRRHRAIIDARILLDDAEYEE